MIQTFSIIRHTLLTTKESTIRTITIFILALTPLLLAAQNKSRARELGIQIGVLKTGEYNAITDISGVLIGHQTIIRGDSIRTGVTAIIPATGNLFQQKLPAAVFVANGFGKLAGSTQITELGNLETPIVLTNTLGVGTAMNALTKHALKQSGNEAALSVNAVVGETNDGLLNDIRGMHIKESDIFAALDNARSGPVAEGNVGAGTGTIAFGFKGGIGTASRKLPASLGAYTVGVLVQTNFGGALQIDGVPVGEELKKFSFSQQILQDVDGSCMIIVATDAPIDSRNLERLAKRAFMGLAKTGGIASNGSGDYVIAFSTATENRIPHNSADRVRTQYYLDNDFVSPLFMAAIEATEEAIVNSMLMAEDMKGKNGREIKALPKKELINILKKYNRIHQ